MSRIGPRPNSNASRAIPLLDGTRSTTEIAALLNWNAAGVREVARQYGLMFHPEKPCESAHRASLARMVAKNAAFDDLVWQTMQAKIRANGDFTLEEIVTDLECGKVTLTKAIARLKAAGRLHRDKVPGGWCWILYRNGERVCASSARYAMRAMFRAVDATKPIDSDVERAKLYLRRRGDDVYSDRGTHHLNARLHLNDAGLVEYADKARARDEILRRNWKRAA